MNETQQRAIVAGFMHVVTTSPALFAEWQRVQQKPGDVGAFIAKTMNLKDAPTAADLRAMAGYADEQLGSHVEKLNSLSSGPPKQVGEVFGLQHEDES